MSILAKIVRGLSDEDLLRVVQAAPAEIVCSVVRAANDAALRPLFGVVSTLDDAPDVAMSPGLTGAGDAHRAADAQVAAEPPPPAPRATDETPEEERRGPRPTGRGSRTTCVEPVVKALRALGGKATLKQLEDRTGFSQTVVSRATRLLEEQRRIRRVRPVSGTTRGAPMTCELIR